MPPKKDPKAVQDADILEQLKMLSKKVDSIGAKQDSMQSKQDQIANLVKEVQLLREESARKDEKIRNLEDRVHDLEQYTRKDDLIITGLRVKHRTYARAADTDEGQTGDTAPEAKLNTLEDQVVSFFDSKEIDINRDSVSACHLLGKGFQGQPPKIILRFTSRKEKTNLLKQGRKLRDTGVYMNEHLTHRNATLAKHARFLRGEKKIKDTWIRNCAVLIRMKDNGVKRIACGQDFVKLGLQPVPEKPDDGVDYRRN